MALYLQDLDGIILIDKDTGVAHQGSVSSFSSNKTTSSNIVITSADTWKTIDEDKGKFKVEISTAIGDWTNYADELTVEEVHPNVYLKCEKDKTKGTNTALVVTIDDASVKLHDEIKFKVSYIDNGFNKTDNDEVWTFTCGDGYTEIGTIEELAPRMKAIFIFDADGDQPAQAVPGSFAFSKDISTVYYYGVDGTPTSI